MPHPRTTSSAHSRPVPYGRGAPGGSGAAAGCAPPGTPATVRGRRSQVGVRRLDGDPGAFRVVWAGGVIDERCGGRLASTLARVADEAPAGVVLDLSRVQFAGTDALAAVLAFAARMRAAGIGVSVYALRPVGRPLRMLGAGDVVCGGFGEAVELMRRGIG